MSNPRQRLVADVGGTNTRIAVYDPDTDAFLHRVNYQNRDFDTFSELLAHWQAGLDDKPSQGCIAIAAPLAGDHIAMVNMSWAFSRRDISRQLRLDKLTWLNDFESNAHALHSLQPSQLVSVHNSDSIMTGPLATVGPGTGLGGATVTELDGNYRVQASEPGQMGLSPVNELELELFKVLLRQHDNIYAELLLSGPGLVTGYQALCTIRGCEATMQSPDQISAAALSGADDNCKAALGLFCDLLGSACGNFILATGAYGGLYLAGGIVPKILPLLRESDFCDRFQHKGAMKEQLGRVPIWMIDSGDTGLIGAAHAPLV
ncbi:MAG: glucokinase [Halieaceae bacterium]